MPARNRGQAKMVETSNGSSMRPRRPVIYDAEGREIDLDGGRTLDGVDPGMVLPHVYTFSGVLRGSSQTYFRERWDEAMKHVRENALAMRRDEHLQACLRERIRGTTSLKWHLEADNPKDPWQKAVALGVERAIKAGYRLRRLLKQSMQALWFGRYGSQLDWQWRGLELPYPRANAPDNTETVKALVLRKHLPVNGDKIDYTWDHRPTVKIYPPSANQYGDDVVLDNLGHSLVLGRKYRHRFLI